jgi:hypothetical protein
MSILVDIHGKQQNIDSIDFLKKPDTLGVRWKVGWAASIGIKSVHLQMDSSKLTVSCKNSILKRLNGNRKPLPHL